MKRIVLLLFMSLGLFLPRPALAGPSSPAGFPGFGKDIGVPNSDYYRQHLITSVDIRGLLNTKSMPSVRRPIPGDFFSYLLNGLDGTIAVGTKLYTLDFGNDPGLRNRARNLDGKKVLLTGRLATRTYPLYPMPVDHLPNPLLRLSAHETVEYVVVTGVTLVDDYVRETINVEIQGRLEVTFRGDVVEARLHAQGQSFVLQFGTKESMRHLVRNLNGRTVRVTGTLHHRSILDVVPRDPKIFCCPLTPRVQMVEVNTLNLVDTDFIKLGSQVEMQGQLAFYRHIRFGRGAVAIRSAGQNFWLDFGSHDDLHALAQQAGTNNRAVLITGTLRESDQAIVVTGLKFAEAVESYKQSVTVEIKGILHVREVVMKCNRIMRTWEITVNGQTYVLEFNNEQTLTNLAEQLHGQTVIVHGTRVDQTIRVTSLRNPKPDWLPQLAK